MKRSACVSVLILAVLFCAGSYGGGVDHHFVGLGLNPPLKYSHDFTSSAGGDEYDTSMGFSLLYEGLVDVTYWFSLGGGLELALPREADIPGTSAEFIMAPAYITCIFEMGNYSGFRPFGSVRLGWMFGFSGNSDYLNGYETSIFGLHLGVGAGTMYKNWRLELRWTRDTGKLESGPGPDINVVDHRVTLIGGYTF